MQFPRIRAAALFIMLGWFILLVAACSVLDFAMGSSSPPWIHAEELSRSCQRVHYRQVA